MHHPAYAQYSQSVSGNRLKRLLHCLPHLICRNAVAVALYGMLERRRGDSKLNCIHLLHTGQVGIYQPRAESISGTNPLND